MPNNRVDTPSSFWGVGGMALALLSISAMLVLIFGFGLLIAGSLIGTIGLAAGLTCMGIGISKNSVAIEDVAMTKGVSTANGISMRVGNVAEKQQTKEKTEQKSKSNSDEVDNSEAEESTKTVNTNRSNLISK